MNAAERWADAVANGQVERMRAMIDAGFDVNTTVDGFGSTALHETTRLNRIDCVRLLLSAGARVDDLARASKDEFIEIKARSKGTNAAHFDYQVALADRLLQRLRTHCSVSSSWRELTLKERHQTAAHPYSSLASSAITRWSRYY